MLSPMLATAGPLPLGDAWAYEPKWDGFRALISVADDQLTIRTRSGRDVTADYPEVSLDLPDGVLDGELVALVDGLPSFGALQQHAVPVTFVPFDLLQLQGNLTTNLPYDDRRALLQDLLPTTPEPFHGDGATFLAATLQQGLEGVVAKRRDSLYLPGRRSDSWIKVKHLKHQSAVVGGWKQGLGGRSGRIGSLLLGLPTAEGLTFIGHVGTGFSDSVLQQLDALLAPLERPTPAFTNPPAEAAHWVEPVLVVEVGFTAWTPDGRLRHPTYRGLRTDLGPEGLARE